MLNFDSLQLVRDREPNSFLDIHWYKIESSNHNATCPKRCFSFPVPKEDFWRFSPFHPITKIWTKNARTPKLWGLNLDKPESMYHINDSSHFLIHGYNPINPAGSPFLFIQVKLWLPTFYDQCKIKVYKWYPPRIIHIILTFSKTISKHVMYNAYFLNE